MDKLNGASALILGATGETGKALQGILNDANYFSKIIAPTRRQLPMPDTITNIVYSDFNDIPASTFESVDHVFCCLGTTRAKAGSADAFINTDYTLVMKLAKLAKDANVPCFHLVSSIGANQQSWFLYPKTKGRLEEDLKKIGFDRLVIYRPGMLMCDREESRPFEALSRQCMAPLLDYLCPKKYSISTKQLAKAMLCMATNFDKEIVKDKAIVTLENKEMHELVQ